MPIRGCYKTANPINIRAQSRHLDAITASATLRFPKRTMGRATMLARRARRKNRCQTRPADKHVNVRAFRINRAANEDRGPAEMAQFLGPPGPTTMRRRGRARASPGQQRAAEAARMRRVLIVGPSSRNARGNRLRMRETRRRSCVIAFFRCRTRALSVLKAKSSP